jgi:hypothetical protein
LAQGERRSSRDRATSPRHDHEAGRGAFHGPHLGFRFVAFAVEENHMLVTRHAQDAGEMVMTFVFDHDVIGRERGRWHEQPTQ